MKKDLITITYSNIDKTDGPVIHYMELWNSFVRQFGDEFDVKGFACVTSTGKPFLLKNEFPVETITSEMPRPVRLIVQDLFFAWKVFKGRHGIVYLRTGNNMFLSVVAARLLNVAFVTEYNGIASLDAMSNKKGGLFSRFVASMERMAIRSSAACVGVSNGIAEHLRASGAKRAVCIKNGVSPDFFQVTPARRNDKIRLVYVGTFTPWDGAKRIVDLARTFPDVEFHLVGDGKHRAEVEEYSRGDDNVFFKGFVGYRDLKAEYAKYDAGLILYEVERNTMELSSLKTLEYMACGLPIFSTRVPGQEFVEENGIGVLTEIEKIEASFRRFLDGLPKLKATVDRYRQDDGQKYSWDRTARETRDLISSLFTSTV